MAERDDQQDRDRDRELSPPQQEHLTSVLGWAMEAIQEGEAFLRSQPGYDKIDRSIRLINSEREERSAAGPMAEMKPSGVSRATSNRFAHIALNLNASMTDIKPFWEYRTSNKRYAQAILGNKLALSWWLTQKIDMKFSETMQYALAGGTGYSNLVYDKAIDDLDMFPTDARDFYPIRPSPSLQLQDSFGTLVRQERSVHYLERRYPKAKGLIKPDRQGTRNANEAMDRYSRKLESIGYQEVGPFWFHEGGGKRKSPALALPMCDLWTIYVRDLTRNTGDSARVMGDPETNRSYVVPPGGLLYPRLRRIVLTSSMVLEDGPSPYWHGHYPYVKLTLDSWPWLWLGKSPLWDLIPLQDELDAAIRALGNYIRQITKPGMSGNQNAVSRALWDKINTEAPGWKIRTNPVAGANPITLHYPPPGVTEVFYRYIEFLINEMETLSGVKDISSLMRLGQIPSSETIEKMIEAMTPLVRLRSRMIEASLRDFAYITMSNFMQFYTLPKRLAILGPSGMTFEDKDTDPGNMIPAIMEEDGLGADSTREQRAKAMLSRFTFHVMPGSLLSASEITTKMLYFQLWRGGLIDRQTLADKLGIANFGEIPGTTIIQKVLWELQNLGAGTASPAGRKASGQEAPRMVIRES